MCVASDVTDQLRIIGTGDLWIGHLKEGKFSGQVFSGRCIDVCSVGLNKRFKVFCYVYISLTFRCINI